MKKFIFLVSFIVLLFSFNSSCFADEFVVQLPELPIHEDYPYYVIYKFSDTSYYLRFLSNIDNNVSIGFNNNGHNHYLLGACPQLCYSFNTNSTEWVTSGSSNSIVIISCIDGSCSDGNIVYCNFSVSYNGSEVLSKHELSTGGFDEPVEEPSILDGIGSFFDSLFEKLGNWFTNLINFVKSIPQLIIDGFKDLFVFLFVPSDNLFDDFKTLIEDKFGIFSQLSNIVFDSTTIELNDSAPNFHISISGKDYTFVDLSFYDKYRAFIHGLIILITAFNLSRWLLINCPNIIKGEHIDPHTGEVDTFYTNHPVGRR